MKYLIFMMSLCICSNALVSVEAELSLMGVFDGESRDNKTCSNIAIVVNNYSNKNIYIDRKMRPSRLIVKDIPNAAMGDVSTENGLLNRGIGYPAPVTLDTCDIMEIKSGESRLILLEFPWRKDLVEKISFDFRYSENKVDFINKRSVNMLDFQYSKVSVDGKSSWVPKNRE